MDIPQISFPNTDKEFINNPYPYLKELREKSPLHLDIESGLVLITHFDDVKNVQKSKNFSSSEPENYEKKKQQWLIKKIMNFFGKLKSSIY
jgi:cytochrome P450